MADLYAQTFDLNQRGSTDLFTAVSETLRGWLGDKWPKGAHWFGHVDPATISLEGGTTTVVWEPWRDGKSGFLDFTMRQEASGGSPYSWRTRLTLMAENHTGILQLRIENDGPLPGTPGAALTTRPRLAFLLDLFCDAKCDGRPVTSDSKADIFSRTDVPAFVRSELLRSNRREPVVVITPREDGTFVVPPDAIAKRLATTARVVALATPDATWGLTSELRGKELSAWHGALRVYLPGLTLTSDPMRHPLLRAGRLSDSLEQMRIAQWLTLLTVARFRDDPRRQVWRDHMALAQTERRRARERELELAVRQAKDAQNDVEEARLFEVENARLHQELANLEAQNKTLREQLAAADDKIRGLRYALGSAGNAGEEVEGAGADEPRFAPADVAEAVLIASEQFGENLRFLPSAHEAAVDSDFYRPEEVLEALGKLAGLSKIAATPKGLGKSFKMACEEQGLDYAPSLSANTQKRIKKQYVFRDGDTSVKCEEHLRLGGAGDPKTNARIYFNSKRIKTGLIVIGHVGRHGEVNSTN